MDVPPELGDPSIPVQLPARRAGDVSVPAPLDTFLGATQEVVCCGCAESGLGPSSAWRWPRPELLLTAILVRPSVPSRGLFSVAV